MAPDPFCVGISRVLVILSIATMITTGVLFVTPLRKYSQRLEAGSCLIKSLQWQELWSCDTVRKSYYVPVITTMFESSSVDEDVPEKDRFDTVFGLFIDESRVDEITGHEATIFDDKGDSPLIECGRTDVQKKINNLLAEHVPALTVANSGYDRSAEQPSIDYNAMEWFPCTKYTRKWREGRSKREETYILLSVEVPNKDLFFVFLGCVAFYCFAAGFNFSLDTYFVLLDSAGIIVCGIIGGIFHLICYGCICRPIYHFANRQLPDVCVSLKKGSVFYLIWVLCCQKCCSGSSEESSGEAVGEGRELGDMEVNLEENHVPTAPSPEKEGLYHDYNYPNSTAASAETATRAPDAPPTYDDVIRGKF